MFNRRRDKLSARISIRLNVVFRLPGEHIALLQLLVPGGECSELRLGQAMAGPHRPSGALRAERAAGAEARQRGGLGHTPLGGRCNE